MNIDVNIWINLIFRFQVHQAGHNTVFSADAYVLFYARINKNLSVASTSPKPSFSPTAKVCTFSLKESDNINSFISERLVKYYLFRRKGVAFFYQMCVRLLLKTYKINKDYFWK